MDLSKGYLRLFRKFEDWEWYAKPNTKAVFIHCLIKANNEDKQWQGIVIKRGQFVTSLESLAIANGLTIRQTRTALNDLQKTNEIDKQTTNRYSIITVKNYNLYQTNDKQKMPSNDKQTPSEMTSKRQQRINNSNNSYINISLSNKKITKEEREILEKYVLKQKRKPDNLQAYIKTLIKNGDWVEIVNKEKQRLEQLQQKKNEQQQTEEERELTEEEQKQQEKEIQEIQKKIKENLKRRRQI